MLSFACCWLVVLDCWLSLVCFQLFLSGVALVVFFCFNGCAVLFLFGCSFGWFLMVGCWWWLLLSVGGGWLLVVRLLRVVGCCGCIGIGCCWLLLVLVAADVCGRFLVVVMVALLIVSHVGFLIIFLLVLGCGWLWLVVGGCW